MTPGFMSCTVRLPASLTVIRSVDRMRKSCSCDQRQCIACSRDLGCMNFGSSIFQCPCSEAFWSSWSKAARASTVVAIWEALLSGGRENRKVLAEEVEGAGPRFTRHLIGGVIRVQAGLGHEAVAQTRIDRV